MLENIKSDMNDQSVEFDYIHDNDIIELDFKDLKIFYDN